MPVVHFTSDHAEIDAAMRDPKGFRFTVEWKGSTFRCCDCGKDVELKFSGGTGYGQAKQDSPMFCYPCGGIRMRNDMIRDGRATLYLVEREGEYRPGVAPFKQRFVTDWTGELNFQVKRYVRSRHNMARWRYDVWFYGPNATIWHGYTVGDNTEICHCKRIKRMPS